MSKVIEFTLKTSHFVKSSDDEDYYKRKYKEFFKVVRKIEQKSILFHGYNANLLEEEVDCLYFELLKLYKIIEDGHSLGIINKIPDEEYLEIIRFSYKLRESLKEKICEDRV